WCSSSFPPLFAVVRVCADLGGPTVDLASGSAEFLLADRAKGRRLPAEFFFPARSMRQRQQVAGSLVQLRQGRPVVRSVDIVANVEEDSAHARLAVDRAIDVSVSSHGGSPWG